MRVFRFLFFFILVLSPLCSWSTHLRAADIIVEQQCNSLTYTITIRAYLNTLSQTPFGTSAFIDFGDGQIVKLPQTPRTPRPDLGPEIATASFSITHTYQTAGTYKINYSEGDRSGGILNIPDSEDVDYSTFVLINAQQGICNKLPVLQVPPVDRACSGVIFFHSAGVSDEDGDSLSYELTIPAQDAAQPVFGFVQPDDKRFYSNFDKGNEAKNGIPSLKINPETGLLTWDAPGLRGQYNVAFAINELRRNAVTGAFTKLSTTIRDMQIVVEDCNNGRPTLEGPNSSCIEAGEVLTATLFGKDPENHAVKIEVFSSILEGEPESFPATYDPVTTDFRPSNPPAELHFEWKTNCSHVRDQAYQVVFKITDSPPSGPKLVTFKTWTIKVIAPAPKWINVEPDLVNRTSKLAWQDYSCPNAEKIQLWRKVGSFPFLPGQCVAGLSIHKGYTLIREFDPSVTTFTDTNDGKKLSVGAEYCYRLVAVFSEPTGGKSYVSVEACAGPILADAPVITNASIIHTAKENGSVEVKWTKPFDISAVQYPEPYQYEVFRSNGFTPEDLPINISGRLLDVTSFIDNTANTEDNVYNYQVVLYSKTQNVNDYNAIDTSSVASTIRLELTPGKNEFTLKWNAVVPWSNVARERPWHRIYRGEFGDPENELELIDSVEVSEFGFEYIDKGTFKNETIRDDVYYCYFVETIGSYGNSNIPLLFNRSQMSCSHPVNTLPLCTPSLAVKQTDCEEYLSFANCETNIFLNELSWVIDKKGCRKDVVSFNLYYSDEITGEYKPLKSLTAMNYNDPVASMARCYKISSLNKEGSESELSEPYCNDNCPFYELPNVFTPNGDGCNDFFSAYVQPQSVPGIACEPADASKCPRFVKAVSFKVLNRWGKLIYEYRSDASNSIYINWDGRDKNGSLLDPGIYFYTADVDFVAVDPARRKKKLKGWLHLVQ
jgi:hypothetical protein